MCSQVQYNLLTPPCSEPGSVQDGGKQSGLPLHYGFKEVEENWAKHCSSGKNGHHSSEHVTVVHIHLIPESHHFCSLLSLDSTVQPKFYCLLSPEASEDDISRLDSKVITLVSVYHIFSAPSGAPGYSYTQTLK